MSKRKAGGSKTCTMCGQPQGKQAKKGRRLLCDDHLRVYRNITTKKCRLSAQLRELKTRSTKSKKKQIQGKIATLDREQETHKRPTSIGLTSVSTGPLSIIFSFLTENEERLAAIRILISIAGTCRQFELHVRASLRTFRDAKIQSDLIQARREGAEDARQEMIRNQIDQEFDVHSVLYHRHDDIDGEIFCLRLMNDSGEPFSLQESGLVWVSRSVMEENYHGLLHDFLNGDAG